MTRSSDLETTVTIDGEDVDVYVEFTIDSWGNPGCASSLTYPGDPPEAPEFSITKIVREDINAEITLPDESVLYDEIFERIYDLLDEPDYPEDY